jgi:hypothetical protein
LTYCAGLITGSGAAREGTRGVKGGVRACWARGCDHARTRASASAWGRTPAASPGRRGSGGRRDPCHPPARLGPRPPRWGCRAGGAAPQRRRSRPTATARSPRAGRAPASRVATARSKPLEVHHCWPSSNEPKAQSSPVGCGWHRVKGKRPIEPTLFAGCDLALPLPNSSHRRSGQASPDRGPTGRR